MLKQLQKKAKPRIDTNLDEAKRLAAIEKKQKEQKMMEKVKADLLEKVKNKMQKQESEKGSFIDESVILSTPQRLDKSEICPAYHADHADPADSPTLKQSFRLEFNHEQLKSPEQKCKMEEEPNTLS